MANLRRRDVYRVKRTEQGSFIVKCFTRIRNEYCRNAERIVQNENGRGRIPCGISARLESVAYAAIGE